MFYIHGSMTMNMKKLSWLVLSILMLTMQAHTDTGVDYDVENIEFICMKTHKATNTCHFNFKVDGANYRFVDVGCKYNKKKDELIRKVQEGEIFLAKDWKVSCPEPKPESGL